MTIVLLFIFKLPLKSYSMKKSILFLLCILVLASFRHMSSSEPNGTVFITVTDTHGEILIGASVVLMNKSKRSYSAITDINGQAKLTLPEDTYTMTASYTGYTTSKTDITILGNSQDLKIKLEEGTVLEEEEEVVVTESTRKLLEGKAAGVTITSAPSRKRGEIMIRGYSGAPADMAKSVSRVSGVAELPSSGQMTAGEWNDLHNWKKWVQLTEEDVYREMETTWDLKVGTRYPVYIENENHIPVPSVQVELKNEAGVVLWTGLTDYQGKAELWDTENSDSDDLRIEVNYNGRYQSIRDVHRVSQGGNRITMDYDCSEKLKMDIMWTIDATSSMSDEIRYLQSELLDVTKLVDKDNEKDIHWASVFYKDKTDDYITKEMNFTDDGSEVVEFIKYQSASGGGDTPEAVSDALSVSLEQSWRPDAQVKLLFLVLDAPPHADQASMDTYKKAVAEAAARGIKIIPITASGLNRATEYLMKFTAMKTNGTYVFLTDDSGIGNGHLEHVTDDYEVEILNDLLVRLIDHYSYLPECQEQVEIVETRNVKIYPNPASNVVNINGTISGDLATIISPSGQVILKEKAGGDGILKIDISQLVAGNYILKVEGENFSAVKRLIVIS